MDEPEGWSNPRSGVCRNCRKPVREVPYGAVLRWTHLVKITGVWVDAGVWCHTTKAEPDRRRRVRNRYAPRSR
jgi:hypothetical protein